MHLEYQYQSPHIITHPSSLLKGISTHPIHVVQDVKTPQTQCECYHCSPGPLCMKRTVMLFQKICKQYKKYLLLSKKSNESQPLH